MTHLKPVNRKAARIERATDNDVVALQRRGGPGAVPPASASRWSATCSTATSVATGRRRCRIS